MTICKDHSYTAAAAFAAGTPVRVSGSTLVAINALTDRPFGVVLEGCALGEIPKIPIDGELFDLSHAALTVVPSELLGATTSAAWASLLTPDITTIPRNTPRFALVEVERVISTTSSRVRAKIVQINGTAAAV
jgi:hypothetical protein